MKKALPIFLIVTILGFFILSFVVPEAAKSDLKKRKELMLLLNEEKIMPQAQTLLSSKSVQIATLEEAFPTKEKLVSTVQYFDSQAAASDVIADLHFESEEILEDPDGDSVIPVKITVEGKYANVLAFLDSLEKGRYFYAMSQIEGEAPDGLGGKNKVSVKANLYASN